MQKQNRAVESIFLPLILVAWVFLGVVASSGAGEPLPAAGMVHGGSAGPAAMEGEDTYMYPGMGMTGTMPMHGYFKADLGLNDDQIERMHKLYSDYEKEMIRNGSSVQIAELELADLLDAKKIDMKAVEKAVKKVENLRSEKALYRVKALMKTQEFLTPEQFEIYKEQIVHQMRHPMRGGYGGMMGYGQGMMPGMKDGMKGHGQGMMPGMMPGMMDGMMPGMEGTMRPGMMRPGMMYPR